VARACCRRVGKACDRRAARACAVPPPRAALRASPVSCTSCSTLHTHTHSSCLRSPLSTLQVLPQPHLSIFAYSFRYHGRPGPTRRRLRRLVLRVHLERHRRSAGAGITRHGVSHARGGQSHLGRECRLLRRPPHRHSPVSGKSAPYLRVASSGSASGWAELCRVRVRARAHPPHRNLKPCSSDLISGDEAAGTRGRYEIDADAGCGRRS
jgi:hypothetical protein